MIFIYIFLAMLLSESALATSLTQQQQINQKPTSVYHSLDNVMSNVVEGLPIQKQSSRSSRNREFQAKAVAEHEQSISAPVDGAQNAAKAEQFAGYYFPQIEEQVTVYPQKDDSDSDSYEDDVGLPVGINPPPLPSSIPSNNFPSYFPIHWVTLRPPPTRPQTATTITTRRPPTTTRRPTTTTTRRPPTTVRPTRPVLPSIIYPPFYPVPLPTTRPPTRPPTTTWPTRPTTTTPRPGGENVEVLESYQLISENGIHEYKIRLSNGLIDHKRITKKRVGNDIIYVQSGYYSTPVDPTKNKFNLIYYIADELGYRITGVQACSSQQPCLPRSE